MQGRNVLVRRAERRMGDELGKFVYIGSSRRISWTWPLPCLVLGFIYATIGQFITPPRSTDGTLDRFENIPLFLTVSALTGLVLWALTFATAFRKLLVFDGGIVTSYAQKATTRIFPWSQLNPASIKRVTSADGRSPTSLLAASELRKLGVRGKYALIFQAPPRAPALSNADSTLPVTSFWTFETTSDPAPLIHALQQAMLLAHIPGDERIAVRTLPPVVLTATTTLD